MKGIWLAAIAAVALAGAARAEYGGPTVSAGPQPTATEGSPASAGCEGRFGMNPFLKKMLFWKKADCAPKAPPPPGTALPGSTGAGMPGTLVFPVNPYVRSPRDFFMTEPR